ncbi:hypothetical protein SISSUDRAFT_966677, partial [Sistotremastrum suecicum HHB10207 ss-3]
QFSKRFHSSLRDIDYVPGSLVLVRNVIMDKGIRTKTEPRYLGPFVVVRKNTGGAYVLAEMNGQESSSTFFPARLVPFYSRDSDTIP